jgi:predicted lipoprotein
MAQKISTYLLLLICLALLGYNSVYIKKLSTIKVAGNTAFDVSKYVDEIWTKKLPGRLSDAVELQVLRSAIETNADTAFAKYTNAMAIGNYRYALVKTITKAEMKREDDFLLSYKSADSLVPLVMATEFIYGNALRDALNLSNEIDNTAYLNAISTAMNERVKKQLLPAFLLAVKPGDSLKIIGAVEINKAHPNWENMEIIPAQIQIMH